MVFTTTRELTVVTRACDFSIITTRFKYVTWEVLSLILDVIKMYCDFYLVHVNDFLITCLSFFIIRNFMYQTFFGYYQKENKVKV